MASLNKVILIGNLGKDVETRFSTDNFSISSFSLATTRSFQKGGEWNNETTWHNIVVYNLQDYYADNLKKGANVYVEGRIDVREYEDKNGDTKKIYQIIADKIIILSKSQKHLEDGKQDASQHTEQSEIEKIVATTDNNSEEQDLPF